MIKESIQKIFRTKKNIYIKEIFSRLQLLSKNVSTPISLILKTQYVISY